MRLPAAGRTVKVFRHGELHLNLCVSAVREEPRYPGWVTLLGRVRRGLGGDWGYYWQEHWVFAELQQDGSVRMLGPDERLQGIDPPV